MGRGDEYRKLPGGKPRAVLHLFLLSVLVAVLVAFCALGAVGVIALLAPAVTEIVSRFA